MQGLADVLKDCVDGGASVSFMLPLAHERALAFWRQVADGVARGERALLVAEDEEGIVGTVQVVLAQPENQPHRADLAKMLVHRRARRQGLGHALVRAAEAEREDGCRLDCCFAGLQAGGAVEGEYEGPQEHGEHHDVECRRRPDAASLRRVSRGWLHHLYGWCCSLQRRSATRRIAFCSFVY
jgi:GNAT superfamily N-acetyltransferase